MRATFFVGLLSLTSGVVVGYCAVAGLRTPADIDWAELLVDSGHRKEALPLIHQHLSHEPWDAQAQILLGRAFAGEGRLKESAQALGSVMDSSPLKGEALLREGQAYLQIPDAMNAEAAWRQCVVHPTASVGTRLHAWKEISDLCAAEDRQEDLSESLWALHSLSSQAGKPAVLQQLLSQRLLRVEPMVRAKRLREFVEGNPQDIKARVALARCYVEANQLDEGRERLDKCLKMAPKDIDCWRGWLWCVYQQGDLDALEAALPTVPKELEKESGFWKLRATAAEERRDWAKAAQALQQAVDLSPNEVDLHSQFAVVLARLGEKDLAAKHGDIARTLRNARRDMTTAYEDWISAANVSAPKEELLPIIDRLVIACDQAGMKEDAQAWARVRKEVQ